MLLADEPICLFISSKYQLTEECMAESKEFSSHTRLFNFPPCLLKPLREGNGACQFLIRRVCHFRYRQKALL